MNAILGFFSFIFVLMISKGDENNNKSNENVLRFSFYFVFLPLDQKKSRVEGRSSSTFHTQQIKEFSSSSFFFACSLPSMFVCAGGEKGKRENKNNKFFKNEGRRSGEGKKSENDAKRMLCVHKNNSHRLEKCDKHCCTVCCVLSSGK